MLPVKLILEIEDEYVSMGYKFGVENHKSGWVHETEPFIKSGDEVSHLKSKGKLSNWKRSSPDNWKEKKHVKL